MKVEDVVGSTRDALSVKRVFGEPYEKDGVTIIPVASFSGGAGGGGDNSTTTGGSGAGFGLMAKPSGAYVIRNGVVSWQPALNLNRIIMGGQVVGLVALLVLRSALKARSKRRR
jgi:uncharacterized spore protein YtfJ